MYLLSYSDLYGYTRMFVLLEIIYGICIKLFMVILTSSDDELDKTNQSASTYQPNSNMSSVEFTTG